MVTEYQKTCNRCGTVVNIDVPKDTKSLRMLRGIGMLCTSCSQEQAREEAAEVALAQQEQHGKRILSSGIPSQLLSVTFDSLDETATNQEAFRLAQSWANGEIKGLVLTGPVGVGKTWTAAAAANKFLERRALRWFSVARMLAQARAGFKNPARDQVNDVLLQPELALVMDDIDKVNPTDFARDILFQAIDERVNNGTPLLVTTNMRYTELEKTYGEPIASRLAGYGKAARIEGEDRRRTP